MKKCKRCTNPLRAGKIYCSRTCYWAVSPKKEKLCMMCGNRFITWPSFEKNGQGFLCSNKCRLRWVSIRYRGAKTLPHAELAARARKKLNTEIRGSRIARMPCEICGNPRSHGHHTDYSKPLDVRWLCARHHQLAHFAP